MIDVVDKKTRSRMMAGIRGRDTRPELKVRCYLHAAGLRFTLHSSRLAGKPDIALRKYRTAGERLIFTLCLDRSIGL